MTFFGGFLGAEYFQEDADAFFVVKSVAGVEASIFRIGASAVGKGET
jgi:hypothetical protein